MAKTNMNRNTINGDNNIMANGDLIYNSIKEENTTINNFFFNETNSRIDYSQNYYRYINKFQELENYLFSVAFLKKEDNHKYQSNILSFGKELIDWILGISQFSISSYESFIRDISVEFQLEENKIFKLRWDAFKKYVEGDIEGCRDLYNQLFEIVQNKNDIDTYLKDDILIDGRNIEIKCNYENNKYSYKNIFQQEIDKENINHKLANPIYDRIKTNIYEAIYKNLFNLKTKSKNTIMYGIGLESICDGIQKLIYITIFYGSITHLILCRELISKTFYLYADALNDEELYLKTLKMLALTSGKKKEFEKLSHWLTNKNIYLYSSNIINDFVNQEKCVWNTYIKDYKCLLYKFYGRYLEEDRYIKYENAILEELTDYESLVFNRTETYIKAIRSNIVRFINKEKLFKTILEYIDKGYSRFYRDISDVLNNIVVEDLTNDEVMLLKDIINKLLDNKDLNLTKILIELKKRKGINDYDKLLLRSKQNQIIYYSNFDENKDNEILNYIIDFMKEKAEARENNPSVFSCANEYMITQDFFIKEKFDNQVRDIIEKQYFPLAKLILTSENQVIYDKVKQLKILAYILVEKNEEYRAVIADIINNINFESPKFEGFRNKNIVDLEINILMVRYLLGQISTKKYINNLNKYILESDKNIIEALKCIDITKNNINTDDIDIDVLYYIFQYCYNRNEDLDIKCLSYSLIKILLKTDYANDIINLMKNEASKCTTNESFEMLKIIKYENIDESMKIIIKEELLKNNNSVVRKMVDINI